MTGFIFHTVLYVLFGVIALTIAFGSFFTVEQETVRIVTTFGKFSRIAHAGLNFKIPLVQAASKKLSLRTEPHDVRVESITKDKVAVSLTISVQYAVIPERAREAFYKLSDPTKQIQSFIFDAVRGQVPQMELDEVFQNKGEIATSVKSELTADMAEFGFSIFNALVTEIDPDAKVKEAMNAINAAQRQQIAAEAQGEAKKTLTIKNAEADRARMQLLGEGVAAERTAIAEGIKNSAELIKGALGAGVTSTDVMNILMATQGFDTMSAMAKNSKSTVIFAPNSGQEFTNLMTGNAAGQIISEQDRTNKPVQPENNTPDTSAQDTSENDAA